MKTILNFSRKEQMFLLASLLFKFVIIYCVYQQGHNRLSLLAFVGNGFDSTSYIEPAITSLQKLDLCRLPGYPLLIRLFYRLFGSHYYLDFLISFQVLLNVISSLFIFKIGEELINRKVGFAAGATFLFLPIVNFYDLRVLTENLNSFFLLGAFFLLIVPNKLNGYFKFFLIGFLVCSSFTFRPVSLLVIPFVGLIALYRYNFNFKTVLKFGLVACVPFLIFETFWISFNYKRFHEIIPIAKSHQYTYYEENFHFHASDLWSSFGGEFNDPNYLENPQVGKVHLVFYPFNEISFNLPYEISDTYTEKFNPKSLAQLKTDLGDCDYCFTSDFSTDLSVGQIEEEVAKRNKLIQTVHEMRSSVIKQHPFIFLMAKSVPMGLFLSQDISKPSKYVYYRHTFNKETWLLRMFIHFWNISISLLLSLGVLGLILLVFGKNRIAGLFALCGLAFLFVYCLVFGMPEWRYITGAVPFLLLGLYYFISRTFNFIRAKVISN